MSDKLVFDLAQEIEGSPNVFVRKDWINILDNQNQNYNNNQSVLDTSQLSNSNKYMSYREAYLSVPFLITLGEVAREQLQGSQNTADLTNGTCIVNDPDLSIGGDYVLGLKNWFGQIIHSFTLDYNGTTIIQQTPYVNMWNSFKLMTSLSLNDVSTQGAVIGFYPDNPLSWAFIPCPVSATPPATGNYLAGYSTSGNGVVNNNNAVASQMQVSGTAVSGQSTLGGGNCYGVANMGIYQRQQLINYDTQSLTGSPDIVAFDQGGTAIPKTTAPYGFLNYNGNSSNGNALFTNRSITDTSVNQLWKSYISARTAYGTSPAPSGNGQVKSGQFIQYSVVASIYLKHIHSFFNMCPLLKGVFMKMTMNLNNTTSTITTVSKIVAENGTLNTITPVAMFCSAVSNPLGGANPLMIASGASNPYAGGTTTAITATAPALNLGPWVTNGTGFLLASLPTAQTSQPLSAVAGANGAVTAAAGSNGGIPFTQNNAINLNTSLLTGYAGGGAINITGGGTVVTPSGGRYLFPQITTGNSTAVTNGVGYCNIQYRANISVGSTCLDQGLTNVLPNNARGALSKSIYLYIPAYTFNPIFEQSYLSSPVKQIKYTDIYQYQVLNVAAGQNFNNLLTNGIANIKSVLILPYYSSGSGVALPFQSGTSAGGGVADTYGVVPASSPGNLSLALQNNNTNTGFTQGVPVWQSPFDPAGTGATSPMTYLSNFNIQISGQNAIYNVEKYQFEHFNNQLYGQNAVNGGLTDGITSALIDRQAFDMEYCYYYVNVERMLPVEQSVPKSVQILGQNYSSRALDLYCFIEYGNEISIDALTGARV